MVPIHKKLKLSHPVQFSLGSYSLSLFHVLNELLIHRGYQSKSLEPGPNIFALEVARKDDLKVEEGMKFILAKKGGSLTGLGGGWESQGIRK